MRSVAILAQAKRSMYPYVSLHAIWGPFAAPTSGEAVPLHLLSLVRPVTVERLFKRLEAIRRIQGTQHREEPFGRCDAYAVPAPPDPYDDRISKRNWEFQMGVWRNLLKAATPGGCETSETQSAETETAFMDNSCDEHRTAMMHILRPCEAFHGQSCSPRCQSTGSMTTISYKKTIVLLRMKRQPKEMLHFWRTYRRTHEVAPWFGGSNALCLPTDELQEVAFELTARGVVLDKSQIRIFLEDLRPWFVLLPMGEVAAFATALRNEIPARCQCCVRDSASFKVWNALPPMPPPMDAPVPLPPPLAAGGTVTVNTLRLDCDYLTA